MKCISSRDGVASKTPSPATSNVATDPVRIAEMAAREKLVKATLERED